MSFASLRGDSVSRGYGVTELPYWLTEEGVGHDGCVIRKKGGGINQERMGCDGGGLHGKARRDSGGVSQEQVECDGWWPTQEGEA